MRGQPLGEETGKTAFGEFTVRMHAPTVRAALPGWEGD
jgi:hypothetical protein